MYGNKPDRWSDATTVNGKHRFTINVLTRMRYCRIDGTIDLKMKGSPEEKHGSWKPWFEHAGRQLRDRRIVFGHWSTLGLRHRPDIIALDTGCVWGGTLTAIRLDDPDAAPVQVPCRACRPPGGD
jgi:bis(5'-nucleosyl)-tetraphosphatase (symmetrical)